MFSISNQYFKATTSEEIIFIAKDIILKCFFSTKDRLPEKISIIPRTTYFM
jgi:hypothetical protein